MVPGLLHCSSAARRAGVCVGGSTQHWLAHAAGGAAAREAGPLAAPPTARMQLVRLLQVPLNEAEAVAAQQRAVACVKAGPARGLARSSAFGDAPLRFWNPRFNVDCSSA